MAINKAGLLAVEVNELPDDTIVASLGISLSSAGVSLMLKILGPEVRVIAPKAMAIKAISMAIIRIIGRPVIGPMPWMLMSSNGSKHIPLRGYELAT